MKWDPKQLSGDFLRVADLAKIKMQRDDIHIERLEMPHCKPNLPKGKVAVYVFSYGEHVLKVGQVGPSSQDRYRYQHYNPNAAKSTLAKSLLEDKDALRRHGLDEGNVGDWIKKNTDRVNFILDAKFYGPKLSLLEAFIQCRLCPRYEGKQDNTNRGQR